MKILVMPKPIEGVSREELLQHAAEEIQAVWELYAQGICREFYTRANEAGRVVLIFESESVEAAKEALAMLPFVQLHLIDFDLIPLAPFTGLVRLFQAPTEEPVGQIPR
jgi:muconolactone delta-isomerase